MKSPVEINISSVIDNSKVGFFQLSVFVLCFTCLLLDGFDAQAISYVGPAVSRELHISRQQLGVVFSALPVGVLFGSLLSGMLADRIGRRPVLIGSTAFFAVLTLLTAQASSLAELRILRVISGVGIGAIMPNAMALVGEFSPKRSRVATMMIVSNGFTAGAAVAGVTAAWLLPEFGWRSVFYVGGTIPLLLVIAMIALLPESLQFLALRRPHSAKLSGWLKRVDAALVPEGRALQFLLPEEEKKSGIPFVALFQDGRVAGTLLLWVINFMNLLNLYTLQNWIPTWATDAGYTPSTAALIGTMVQVGGAIGAFGLGWFVPKFGFIPVLATCSILACVNIAAIGQPFLTVTFLFVVVFIAGICVVGGQAAINSLSATYYPTDLRSTGIGAGLGVGRTGAILGPTLAGFMLQHGWSGRDLFVAAAVPPMIAAVALFAWPALTKRGAMMREVRSAAVKSTG